MIELISQKFWAIEPDFFEKVKPLALRLISNGKDFSAFQKRKIGANIQLQGSDSLPGIPEVKGHPQIAVIPLFGGMTKRGDMCSYGMQDISYMIDRVNKSENHKAWILLVDSGGGTVDGTPEFANDILNSKKPNLTFIDGMYCSAAVWAGSGSKFRMANKLNHNTIGSIGTLYMHINQSEWIKENVGEVTIFRSTKSEDKARINSIEPLTDEQKSKIINELDKITVEFHQAVKNNLGDRVSEDAPIWTGETFDNKLANKYGLVDAIGTFEDAVKKTLQLIKEHEKELKANNVNGYQSNHNSNLNQNHMSLMGFLTGKEKAEDGKISMTTEEVENLKKEASQSEAAKEASKAKVTELQSTVEEKTAKITELEASIAEKDKQIETLTADKEAAEQKAEEYGQKAGAIHTKPKANADKQDEEEEEEFLTQTDIETREFKKKSKMNANFKLN
ncbi:S49 family peptidase [Marivirga sp.]|uniref:S49 family peptidase n=1 Tax=Marivirga sp. TaxID=2018662 RepID=UPI003DA78A72